MAARILDDLCDVQDLKKYEQQYRIEMAQGRVTNQSQFEYAWCLVRTTNKRNLETGINLLENLYRKRAKDEQEKRDYMYYMVIAYAKLKDYDRALQYCDGLLQLQPNNAQIRQLREEINKRMRKEGMVGAAIAGGALAVGVAGIATLIGLAISKRKKQLKPIGSASSKRNEA